MAEIGKLNATQIKLDKEAKAAAKAARAARAAAPKPPREELVVRTTRRPKKVTEAPKVEKREWPAAAAPLSLGFRAARVRGLGAAAVKRAARAPPGAKQVSPVGRPRGPGAGRRGGPGGERAGQRGGRLWFFVGPSARRSRPSERSSAGRSCCWRRV